MNLRLVQIWGFLLTVLGWIFMACSLAMEGWKITSIGGMGGSSIVKVAWYWSSLWRSCFTDSTAVTNCYDFPVLWSVDGHIQMVRALLMAALSVGMLGFILSLMGMECTFIGGRDRAKYRKIFSGGVCHITSGILAASGYAVYAIHVSAEYFNPYFVGLKFDLGTPLFLGWVGSAFHMTGGLFYLFSVGKLLCEGDRNPTFVLAPPDIERDQAKSTTSLSSVPNITSKIKAPPPAKISSKSSRSPRRGSRSRRSSELDGPRRSSEPRRNSESGGRSSRSLGSAHQDRDQSSSGTVSSLSSGSRSVHEREQFIKNTYI
ncbi:claudin-10 [Esox lucius]|uniref:Uncharacterized protein n=1 Tax=Esox lucius TaxID=8010 RepID=A0A3P9AMJ4_ESOLU|nr:claudin-10 [Esox lucius]